VKVLRLDLTAYGPFTDAALDLSGGAPGLHIVYGPNEAGKSTALRALRHLLYGIPERSPDAFRHPFPKLRIGGALQAADGRIVEIVRRKGRSGTLRRPDESVLPESELQRFLNGVDADFFATMFGIGYEDLVAGGTAIVEGGGDLGRLLFSAGSGSAPLGRVLDELKAEADVLFRPSGQKQRINEAASRLKQLRSELTAAQLMGTEWAQHDRALRTALAEKDQVECRLAAGQKRLNRLVRIADALPVIAERRETLQALQAVAEAALLPEGFAERRVQASTRLRAAESERDQAQSALSRLRTALTGLGEPQLLLGYADRLDQLHQDLGSQRKAARDSIGLESDHSRHRTEAVRVLRSLREDLTLGECERLRLRKTEAVRIGELGAEYERISGRIESTRARIPEFERQAAAVNTAIQALPGERPVEDLKRRLAEVEPVIVTERNLPGLRAEAELLRKWCIDAVSKLGLTLTDLRELGRLPVPTDEIVQHFQDRLDRLEQRFAAEGEEVRKIDERLAEAAQRLEETRLEPEVPTEADLQSARTERDDCWRIVRGRLQGTSPADGPNAGALAARFEAALHVADTLSDRLRREADRAAAKSRLLAEHSALQSRRQTFIQQRAELQNELQSAGGEWEARWQAIPVRPGSPREMRRWLIEFSLLVEKAAQVVERDLRCETMQAEVQAACGILAGLLASLGEPLLGGHEALAETVRRGRGLVGAEEKAAQQRVELERERLRLQEEIAAAGARMRADETDLRRWKSEWANAVEPLGIGSDARPAEAGAVMEELGRLFHHLDEAEKLQKRLEAMRQDTEAFARNVRLLAQRVAGDLVQTPPGEAALELQRRLHAARDAQSRREALSRQIEEAEERLRTAEGTIAAVQASLTDMCLEACCATPAELPSAERCSAERCRLEARLGRENERLLQLGGGAGVDDFIREASEVDPDGIGGEILRLKEDLRQLTARKSELDQRIGSARAELGRMDGGNRAARLAEDIQALLGRMERDVEHYSRLKIATRVLESAIERFRERSQGPILRRACALFRNLTCGSFEGVRAELGGEGRPVIVGLRPGGRETVPVQGMSDGTADQLFLALRLAGLEHYLASNEAMPFVVDDILIKFDDDRSSAALQALSELSLQTQVIFFTHHRHLLALARDLSPAGAVIHSLAASSP
jgi:uncharacterized protein YhaN